MIKKKNNTPALIYLTDSSLSLQTEKKVLATITFPEELVKDKRIIDEDALKAFISQKIEKIPEIKNSSVVVIGKGMLFQTAIPNDSSKEKENEFFSSISFAKSEIAERRIQTKSKEYILITNKKFYQTIISALEDQAASIKSVVPLSLFVDEVDEDVLSPENVKTIFSKEQLYSQANFLDSQEIPPEADEVEQLDPVKNEETSPSEQASSQSAPFTLVKKWNITALLVILGFLAISTIIFGGFLFFEQKRFARTPLPTPTTMSDTKPEPTVVIEEELDKEALSVSILNGTGTAGQAAKVKTLMEELGYEDIGTGNADSAENTKTTVSFSDKVTKIRSDEIVKSLEEVFSSVTVAKDDSLESDILIVTGEEK